MNNKISAESLPPSNQTTDLNNEKIEVKYFLNEHSFKQRLQFLLLRNQRTSFFLHVFNVVIKLISCVCYVIRVENDIGIASKEYTCNISDEWLSVLNPVDNVMQDPKITNYPIPNNNTINYWALIWICEHRKIWMIQIVISIISILEAFLLIYISYKHNFVQLCTSPVYLMELLTSVPCLITLFSPQLHCLFVPTFLNCWLAKIALETLTKYLDRVVQKTHSAVVQQITVLGSTFSCLVFTASCGFQHLQRAGRKSFTLFQSYYFIVVTFSTVGYGDLYPDIWISQLFVILMICVAFVILPKQVEQLLLTWMEKQKSGGDYGSRRAKSEKHVVVCMTTPRADTILDFLNEFYAHPLLQDFFVLLMSPADMDTSLRLLTQIPIWSQRVIYIKGSTLRDEDLERVKLNRANACFILAARNYADKNAADQHTILRSWAVRDFAPKCPQYVQIFLPENKMHVKHAEFVMCEDEFKYALLANNCICPGISTFITLLLHTSRGQEGQQSKETWHQTYGRHSGNEIYHTKVAQSKLFREFIGKSFTYASFHAHRKYGVGLVAVQKEKFGSTIQLNPGPRHILKSTDVCYYMSITEEDQMTLVTREDKRNKKRYHNKIGAQVADDADGPNKNKRNSDDVVNLEPQPVSPRRQSIDPVLERIHGDKFEYLRELSIMSKSTFVDDCCLICDGDCETNDYVKGFPPVSPYIGTSATICYLLRQKKPLCCLQLDLSCIHCPFFNASEYRWRMPAIILSADQASNGIYNFIIPLRAHCRPSHELNPIILMLEQKPKLAFLDSISYFPMIYWMIGNIDSLDSVLRAGISFAEHVVVVNKKYDNNQEDDYLADSHTVVAVQTMFKLFPRIRVITELTHSSNMRFMQFNTDDMYTLLQSKTEKDERERGSSMAFMFRLPFAAGNVFSATMLDTLLYQALVKQYLIHFVRLLLGIDQASGSGYLSSIVIREEDLWIRSYGRLYQMLCSTEGDIPIAIYRTNHMNNSSIPLDFHNDPENKEAYNLWQRKINSKYFVCERQEISNLVRNRLQILGLPNDNYSLSEKRGSVSFVIINPKVDFTLELGDLVYVLKTGMRKLLHSFAANDETPCVPNNTLYTENIKPAQTITISSCPQRINSSTRFQNDEVFNEQTVESPKDQQFVAVKSP